ncbi:interferon-induced GTP-binding protein Mx-like isoform X2 [Alosa sapidissima]|uniref:interferon-induced GTP-binding protein Mx-like isoform X2 n=1 Tax=Alosa sapidissima TaxID=34773 RepID=UPI001C09D02B|nr:interferon-induced GTP-binding protein Mx-like isoform X2 [Alosa sapidissima]
MSKKNSTPLEEINHLSQHYEEKVRPCIDLVDSLRSLGVEQDLALPAIAVIGDQSSGKSSVLEALSGVALPRGTAQNALAGEGKDISHEMINLEIHSTSVPDLTLIDLPGIARVATGNQSQDIEEQIKRLIETFIKKQETINLVVVPANVDIATTEALKMAKTVDPHGQRTLGILTKPDLVDKGAEEIVVNTLNNLVIPLKKGYMVVKCRGQKDINDKMSLTKALDREKKFFENHTHLRACLDEGKATIPHLSERLTNELVSHIKRSLPQLEKQIKEKLEKASTDLRRLGDGVPQDETERANFLIEKINSFNQVLTDMVRAEEYVGDSQTRVFTNIRILFSKWKTELDNKAIQLEEYLRDEVEDSNTHRGKELPGFVNYRTFETIVRRHVEDLEEPAMNLLRATTETITTAVNQTTSTFFEAYPSLMRAAKDPLEDLREQEFERAEERLKSQFKMERIVYSQDGLYSRQLEAVKARPESTKPFVFVKPISADIREMAQHLSAYYMITSDRLANQVPLIVMYHMLEQYIVNVKAAMSGMIRHKDADSFVQEKGDIARKRKYLSERIERLKKARQVLAKSVPDI